MLANGYPRAERARHADIFGFMRTARFIASRGRCCFHVACDFLQVTDLLFRPLFAFFVIELHSRKVIHVGVTRSPTDAWVAQQLREATPYGQAPKYLIRDNDSKFGPCFARVARTSGIKLLKTPVRTTSQRHLRTLLAKCAAGMPRPSVDC